MNVGQLQRLLAGLPNNTIVRIGDTDGVTPTHVHLVDTFYIGEKDQVVRESTVVLNTEVL